MLQVAAPPLDFRGAPDLGARLIEQQFNEQPPVALVRTNVENGRRRALGEARARFQE